MWQSKNRGSPVPEYLELQNTYEAAAGETVEWAMQELTRRYDNFDADDVKLTEKGNKVLISVQDLRFPDKDRWTKPQPLFDEEGNIRGDVSRLKGFQQATRSMLERLRALTERVEIEKRAEELQRELEKGDAEYAKQGQLLADAEKKSAHQDERMKEMRNQLDKTLRERDKAQRDLEEAQSSGTSTEALRETLEEREEEYMKQTQRLADAHRREVEFKDQEIRELVDQRTRIRRERNQTQRALNLALQELDLIKDDTDNLQTTIAGSLVERRRLMAEINTMEEQVRQRDQAIEDLEGQIERQQEVIADQTRTEEEREAAQRELETLQERVAELRAEKEKLEKELGLTTKEKVKRALVKYGIPLAFAVAISSVVGVILSTVKATGAGVSKLGSGLTDLGKKMAAGLPGLLGSVVSLVLRTGGELLKFVGNNVWILVVAIGVVLLKKMKG
ncbi:cingulin-like protein 1 [Actinia tenebrosa]|uniref:Cingulin-like protein 1 n=1 Tax=Actinia tenebrosa TaxID=6105 RepID=A0A6P8HVE3_ACTTE|nr:cingulin-like protein 1 [Actinia tenebrosa]